MSAPAEKLYVPSASAPDIGIDTSPDRRADIDGKQAWVASLLREVGCDGLLVFEPENFAWLTGGGASRSILDNHEAPVLYFSPEQHWVLAPNFESQRLFDEELDALGFQLKEWPWHWGREQLLADLCSKRKVACDRHYGECKAVGDRLRRQRRALSTFERACYRSLGAIVSHALEATCRTLQPRQMEREIAGQLGHRLLHRGAYPVGISVAADGRAQAYRLCGFTAASVEKYCTMMVTARKYGLCVTASRTMSFGPADEALQRAHDTACKVTATYIASTWPDAVPGEILNAGKRIYAATGYEHEWRLSPQGHAIGRAPVELLITPRTEELLQNDWAVTWRATVESASSCDTYLVTDSEEGARIITPTEMWPLKRIRFQGVEIVRPGILER
jgi:Xaa-Pro aminopeptidase